MQPMELHVGCMNFGKRTPEPEAKKIIARALERGLRFFDTANVYNDGESERVIGRALGKDRETVKIATKVGFGRIAGKPEGLRPERVIASIFVMFSDSIASSSGRGGGSGSGWSGGSSSGGSWSSGSSSSDSGGGGGSFGGGGASGNW